MKLTFRVPEEGTGFFAQIRKIFNDIYSKMNRSQCCVEIPGVGRIPIDEIEGILEDDAGNVIFKMGDDAADVVSDGRKVINGGKFSHIRNLDGLNKIRNHLIHDVDGLDFEPNKAMMNKIEEMLSNNQKLTGAYKDFYEHELTESILMKQGYGYNYERREFYSNKT